MRKTKKRRYVNPEIKKAEINSLINHLIESEKNNIETIQEVKKQDVKTWLESYCGGYDYISINGSDELNSKMNFFLSEELNDKEIHSIISRINKVIKQWINQDLALEY